MLKYISYIKNKYIKTIITTESNAIVLSNTKNLTWSCYKFLSVLHQKNLYSIKLIILILAIFGYCSNINTNVFAASVSYNQESTEKSNITSNTNVASVANKINNLSLNQLPFFDFTDIYKKYSDSVVNVSVTQELEQKSFNPFDGDPFFDRFFKSIPQQKQKKYKTRGFGSGFVISSDGYILTNAHVVANSTAVNIKFNNSKKEYKAKVVGYDEDTDVAVLKIDGVKLKPVSIGDASNILPGSWVVAIGSPFNLENTITHGIISAVARNLPDGYAPYIQTDVPINPGNSGGPLINLKGEVIGINSQIYTKSGGYMGISFAIPIDYALSIANQIKAKGKVTHARLGIVIQPLTEELASSFGLELSDGVLVNSVDPKSAADGKLLPGDIILKINGAVIKDMSTLPRVVNQVGPNKEVILTVWRNSKIMLIKVTPSVYEKKNSNIDSIVKGKSSTQDRDMTAKLGIKLAEIDGEKIKQQFGIAQINYGLVVKSVDEAAEERGLEVGDIIISVGASKINSYRHFDEIVRKYKKGSQIPMRIIKANISSNNSEVETIIRTAFITLTIKQ